MEIECGPVDQEWTQALQRLRNHFFDRDIAPMRPRLKAHCLKLTRDPVRADDLMQDTLMRCLAICRICGGPRNLRAYVLRMASNLWIDQVRKNKRAKKVSDTVAALTLHLTYESPESLLEWIAAQLPAREFEALVLTKVCGYSVAEAAHFLETSPAAIKMATSRARNKLRKTGVSQGLG